MHKISITIALLLALTIPASADKLKGSSTLKDSQPTGTTDKEHKHQAYDLSFHGSGKDYTCRTPSNKKMDATQFVVGGEITYEVDGNKGKIKNPKGKQVQCKIVRVEDSPVP
jgi:hypothetical protein